MKSALTIAGSDSSGGEAFKQTLKPCVRNKCNHGINSAKHIGSNGYYGCNA